METRNRTSTLAQQLISKATEEIADENLGEESASIYPKHSG